MCGIIGIANENNCIPTLLLGLQTLEYRGYDSAGIASNINNNFAYQKTVGKISNLINKLNHKKLQGNTAIAHTRWATHGKPSLVNAHPFVKENCALVHNGIIEYYEELIKMHALNINNIYSQHQLESIYQFVFLSRIQDYHIYFQCYVFFLPSV